MNCFTQIQGLSEQVLHSLKNMNFATPTPIQAQSIPLALAGKDILGSAQTGTGKTGAFAIPLVTKILNNEIQSALVLTPTRELAVQVLSQITVLLGKNSPVHTALLIGGEPMPKQFAQLRRRPRIVVGTPGRINDHLERGTVSFKQVGFLVLDETDRMLDMGFGRQIDAILAHFPGKVQTLMFSATMPNNIMQMASKYLTEPVRIEIGSSLKPIEAVDQKNAYILESEKYDTLLQEIDSRDGSIIVFVKTKFGAKKIADKLYKDGCQAQAIHGNLRQSKRDSVLKMFRNNKFRVLVATDVAARGLDVPHIQHVINHDLPQCPEDYIHRIGRTARAGAKGFAINFITSGEKKLWRAIERFMSTGDQAPQRGSGQGGRKPFERSFRRDDARGNFKSTRRFSDRGGNEESRSSFYRSNDNDQQGGSETASRPARRSGSGSGFKKRFYGSNNSSFSKRGSFSAPKRND